MAEMNTRLLPEPSEQPFSQRNFERLARLIHQHSGIKMPPAKRTMLAVRLRNRIAALGLQNLDEYCEHLFDAQGLDGELVHLIDAVSTNKTDFFREPAHFEFLRAQMLPHFAAAGRRALKFWSAAASIGAEAYSLAMVLEDFRQSTHGPDYSILATDISTAVLKSGLAGRYPAAMMQPVPLALRRRFVLQSRAAGEEEVRIVPQLRAKLAWGHLNLMDRHYPVDKDFDCIFCRNILIYFDKPTQNHVLTRLCEHLRPGGYLILGHSETGAGENLPVIPVMSTILQKVQGDKV